MKILTSAHSITTTSVSPFLLLLVFLQAYFWQACKTRKPPTSTIMPVVARAEEREEILSVTLPL